jgi:hypothetical protein
VVHGTPGLPQIGVTSLPHIDAYTVSYSSWVVWAWCGLRMGRNGAKFFCSPREIPMATHGIAPRAHNPLPCPPPIPCMYTVP